MHILTLLAWMVWGSVVVATLAMPHVELVFREKHVTNPFARVFLVLLAFWFGAMCMELAGHALVAMGSFLLLPLDSLVQGTP